MLRGKLHIFMALPAVLLALLLFGCSSGEQIPRDNTPQVLIPQADGVIVYESGGARIDASHLEDGYFCASYSGTSDRVKLQATGPDGVTYTYDLAADGSTDVFPLSAGDGSYTVAVYENITDNKYSTVLAQTLNVSLKNEFTPFLYPNQFVNYNEQTKAVAKGAELTEGCATDLEAVTAIYDFVTSTISYDNEKARQGLGRRTCRIPARYRLDFGNTKGNLFRLRGPHDLYASNTADSHKASDRLCRRYQTRLDKHLPGGIGLGRKYHLF